MNAPERTKPRVAVVFGGRSSEHAISCVTAGAVMDAIDREKYDVVPIGIARDGRWVLESDDTARLRLAGDRLPAVDGERPAVALLREEAHTDLVVTEAHQPPVTLGEVDVVFPVLHGPWGEDGTIQGMLEMAGVRYVGAGVLASAVSMDKAYMKVVLEAAGIPVMPGVVITARRWKREPDACRAEIEALGFPLFVKPARGGSSIGISKVHDASEIDAAIALAQAEDPKVLVEVGAVGAREIECGVLEGPDGEILTSQPAEIRIGGDHEWYDFEAKYLPAEHTELDIPAVLPDEVAAQMRILAARVFEAVSGEGLARVDFFVMPDHSLVVNELNTMPGFTPTSMYPQMWAAAGVTYSELVDRLIQLALERDTGLR
ncbi:D-alanine--D-alanine ligase family protein [Nocardioides daphniae]|uniref:D-alanine--D-alanine ligase n=1 Tax=Nocardioides daphniae TaxID=402297 RepID=A0ABQ1Q8B4_9ACTN|nr:D-alanine--D-alanine ligase family protein [Nocardioides daphniae]GGD17421.1 D-alanine--D-alanine ligase [Nocardioides daphniae]